MHHDSKQTTQRRLSRELQEDQDALLADLKKLADRSQVPLHVIPGLYEEVYESDSIPPLTPLPLKRAATPRGRGRIVLVATVAATCFLAGSATSYGIAGLEKNPVPPAAIVLEPPKDPSQLDVGIAQRTELPAEPVSPNDDDVETVPEEPSPEPVESPGADSRVGRVRSVVARPAPRRARPPLRQPEADVPPSSARPVGSVAFENVAAELPEAPSRAQLLAGLRGASAAVAGCGLGEPGRVIVDVRINGPTGRIDHVAVTGGREDADPICVARAIRTASFPRFRDDDFIVRSFPYPVR